MNLFLIRAIKDTGEEVFWGIDQHSGGYPYWSHSLFGAKFFDTEEEAESSLTDSSLTAPSKMSDGSIHPPYMVHSAAGLCNKKLKGSFKLEVVKLQFEVLSSKEICAEFKPRKMD